MAIDATPLLLCDHVYEDPVSHNVTLLGIFTTIRATKLSRDRKMSIQEQRRDPDGQSVPESEPVVVMRHNRGPQGSAQNDDTVKTTSEPVAVFTMNCSMTRRAG